MIKSTSTNYAGAADRETTPIFIDVFAGCGGLSLGLKRAGWHGLFAIEKDEFAFSTLEENFAGHPLFDYAWPQEIPRRAWDIQELISTHRGYLSTLPGKIDLLAGGPPCQGFSHAGRRRNDDPRNRLFEDYLSLVDIVQPEIVLIENVRGFTSTFEQSPESGILNFAEALQERLHPLYHLNAEIIRAADFGIPQLRPRFFLIGTRRGSLNLRRPADLFDSLRKDASAFLAERELSCQTPARDALSDLEVGRNGVIEAPDSPGFNAIAYSAPITPFQRLMRDGHEGIPSDTRLAKHRPDISQRFAEIIKACREDGRLNTTISSDLRKKYGLSKMAIRVLDPLRPAPTITSLPDDLLHYSEPRTLTVRENARLQTFPDWFAFKGKYTTGGHLRRRQVPRFTQVANAVPPLLAEQIGLQLLRLIDSHRRAVGEGITHDIEGVAIVPQLSSEPDHPLLVD